MATLSNVLTFSRAQAQTDSNGLTDANGIIFANEALFDYRRRLLTRGIEAGQTQESYRDGSVPSTSGDGSTFAYPEDFFRLKAIEVNFTDTSANNYKTATQIDVSNLPAGKSFSWARSNLSTENPMFDDRGDHFEIFPAFTSSDNTSQAIRIFYYLTPTEYSSTSDNISYPESLDYRILGIYIAASWLQSQDKFNEANQLFMKYERRVDELVGTLSRGSQQPIQAIPIQDSGWEY